VGASCWIPCAIDLSSTSTSPSTAHRGAPERRRADHDQRRTRSRRCVTTMATAARWGEHAHDEDDLHRLPPSADSVMCSDDELPDVARVLMRSHPILDLAAIATTTNMAAC